jgi:hypothetical protein
MPKKFTITDQQANEAKPVYWEFTGRNIYKEPNPAQKLMQVHNALQNYLKMKQTLLRDAKVGEEYPRARASNVQTLRGSHLWSPGWNSVELRRRLPGSKAPMIALV